MKNKINLFMTMVIFLTSVMVGNVNASGIKFTDVSGHWAEKEIIKLVTDGVLTGYEDGSFKPENKVTIAEFLKMIVVAGNYELVREGNNIWPDFYINTALKNNLISKNESITAKIELTRYQASKIVANFVGVEEINSEKNVFKDLNDENKKDVLSLVKLKIVSGYKDGTFRGENTLTRAEAVTIISRACEKKKELVVKREYDYEKEYNLSNYKSDASLNGAYSNTRYEIKEGKILIYDDGKYATLTGYEVVDNIIKISNVISCVKNLITENGYVALLYQPSKYTINQLQILYGRSEDKVASGQYNFSITLFEDKEYELSRISMEEKFSNKCIARIDVLKLWENYSDFQDGKFVDSVMSQKFKMCMEDLFGKGIESMSNYIIKKNEKYVSGKLKSEEIKEHKVFSKYVVDFYKKENGIPRFYISKK